MMLLLMMSVFALFLSYLLIPGQQWTGGPFESRVYKVKRTSGAYRSPLIGVCASQIDIFQHHSRQVEVRANLQTQENSDNIYSILHNKIALGNMGKPSHVFLTTSKHLKGRLNPPVSDEKSSLPFHRSVGSPRE